MDEKHLDEWLPCAVFNCGEKRVLRFCATHLTSNNEAHARRTTPIRKCDKCRGRYVSTERVDEHTYCGKCLVALRKADEDPGRHGCEVPGCHRGEGRQRCGKHHGWKRCKYCEMVRKNATEMSDGRVLCGRCSTFITRRAETRGMEVPEDFRERNEHAIKAKVARQKRRRDDDDNYSGSESSSDSSSESDPPTEEEVSDDDEVPPEDRAEDRATPPLAQVSRRLRRRMA